MPKSIGEEFMDKYGKEIKKRERGHVARGAAEMPPVTQDDVDAYTIPQEPKEGETTVMPGKTAKEWIEELKKTAGLLGENEQTSEVDTKAIARIKSKMKKLAGTEELGKDYGIGSNED